MNEPINTDFFHEIKERDAHLVAPENYQPYQETKEDRLHDELLKDFKAQIDEKFGAVADDDLGELPFDDEADRKRWDELEKDFDRVFDEAKNQ